MDLKTFLTSMSKDQRKAFAQRCSSNVGHLQNVMYGVRPCAPDLAVTIERESGRAVTRPELRPADWEKFWPELVQRPNTACRDTCRDQRIAAVPFADLPASRLRHRHALR